MRRSNLRPKAVALTIAFVSILAVIPIQSRIDAERATLVQEDVLPTQVPQAAAFSAALGGFRGIAVDILWIQADAMLNNKQFYQLATYYELISLLQPNFPAVWEFNSLNLAYNISAEWGLPEEKWEWIKRGAAFARKGLDFNRDSASLHNWAGWLYFDKVNDDPYFAKKFREEEGLDSYLEAYRFFVRAAEISHDAGELNPRYSGNAIHALFNHGTSILQETGNLPAAMEYYRRALAETEAIHAEFPRDAAITTLLATIRDEIARLS